MRRSTTTRALLLVRLALCAIAQKPAPAPAAGPILSFTATTANVGGAPDSIRIDVMRWSTDAERDRLMAAWNMTVSAGRGGAGRGAGKGGGRADAAAKAGRSAADNVTPDPDAVGDPF